MTKPAVNLDKPTPPSDWKSIAKGELPQGRSLPFQIEPLLHDSVVFLQVVMIHGPDQSAGPREMIITQEMSYNDTRTIWHCKGFDTVGKDDHTRVGGTWAIVAGSELGEYDQKA